MERFFILAPVFLLLLGSTPVEATTFFSPRKTSSTQEIGERLAAGSDTIVTGKVLRITGEFREPPDWFPDGMPLIVSSVEIEVRQSFKGERKKVLTVNVPGGCVAETGECLNIGLYPTFQSDENVLLFLERRGDSYSLKDPSQGKQSSTSDKIRLLKETISALENEGRLR
ncbi:MAG: hypothetical protein Q7T11_03350 [Deltaproteobacteria bacterium]|nr:hypothetical protein [Deltaproteobacteria bacterium]